MDNCDHQAAHASSARHLWNLRAFLTGVILHTPLSSNNNDSCWNNIPLISLKSKYQSIRCCTGLIHQLYRKWTLPSIHAFRAQTKQIPYCSLTARGLDLLRRTLSTLLARQSRLTLWGTSSTLRLLSLLRTRGSSPLVLSFLDSSCACSSSGLGSLVSALLDDIEWSSNNSTLRLDGSAGALLGYFLLYSSAPLL